ncbi:hypothetical protein I9Y31_002859 [Clostridium perfringens]|nr:hypothetical protein [Clostridium perfringens]
MYDYNIFSEVSKFGDRVLMVELIFVTVGVLLFLFKLYKENVENKKREISLEELDQKYEYKLTIQTKNEYKKDFRVFSNWEYKSEDILNFVMNKELQSIEYKKNGNSILIPISEIKSYEFRVEERGK